MMSDSIGYLGVRAMRLSRKQLIRIAALPSRLLGYKLFRSRPVWVTFDVSWNCNCRCQYCNYWKEDHEDLPTSEIRSIIRNLQKLGVVYLGISGGEPLLRKDIVDIVGFAKDAGMYVGLNTNGTINREDLYTALMRAGLDTMCFSIDGASPATHEQFRKNCLFGKVVQSIQTAVRIRNEGAYRTQITTNTVVHRGNVDELEEISRWRQTLGVDRNNFQPVVTANISDAAVRSNIGFSQEDRELLERVQAALSRIPGGNLEGFIDQIVDYYTGGKRSRSLECYAGRAFAYVDPMGMLYPCSILMKPLGSLRDDGITGKLKGEEAVRILKAASAQKCPGCSLVCYMERNVMLNNAFSPRMWREILFKRYKAAWRRPEGTAK
jgi:AdoMet-dependent heme synthase